MVEFRGGDARRPDSPAAAAYCCPLASMSLLAGLLALTAALLPHPIGGCPPCDLKQSINKDAYPSTV